MKLDELITTMKDSLTAKRVYAEPYEKDGVTVIAAATIYGGGGGGSGHDQRGEDGEGGGFGLVAKPAGVYLVKDGDVRWRPAVDVNRLISTLGAIVIAGLFAGARIVEARDRARTR